MKSMLRIAASLFIIVFIFGAAEISGDGKSVPPRKGVSGESPSLTVKNLGAWGEYWETGFRAVYKTLLKNLHGPDSFFETRYAYPSPIFRGVYLWDSAFIAQAWKTWDVGAAMDVNRAVIDHADNGRLQHLASKWQKSDYTQPPVMAWSVWENYEWSGDTQYLERVYPTLVAYNRWLYSNRMLDCGLFHWAHSYESGIDNSPRFGSADESVKIDVANLAAVDFSAFVLKQNETLKLMAAELGNEPDAKEFGDKAERLKRAINELLWDEATGYYYDRDMAKNSLVKIRTIASFFPLFAGAPDERRAKIMRDHIMNPAEFNTTYPLPSVARDESSFEKDCWRGPIWINTAYVVIVGLENYGFKSDAADLSFRIADTVYANYKETGELLEFYDPDVIGVKELHRKRGNLYKRITLGDKPRPNFAGWTALANTLVVEHLIGCKKSRGVARIEPNFPGWAGGSSFELAIPSDGVKIKVRLNEGGGTQVEEFKLK